MEGVQGNSLADILKDKKSSFEKTADSNRMKVYAAGIKSIEDSDLIKNAKKTGDLAPNFSLKNALGKEVTLEDYLKKGKVVLTWYRGGWCPYCNFTLQFLQKELENFKANGANLLALTPELPDNSLSTRDKHDLKFEVLSDVGNKVAKKYGIVFELTKELAAMYNAGFNMNGHNGDTSNELPLAATYIINEEGEIIYSFLDSDYRNRAEPSELTKFLKNN